MGFDVGQVAQPGPVAVVVFQPVQELTRQPRRLGILVANIGGQIGMRHQPPRQHLTGIADRTVGEVMPGIGRVIALAAQVFVIGRVGLVVDPVGALGPQAIVANHHVKSALRHTGANHGLGFDAHPLHAGAIRHHVGLADQPGVIAQISHVIAQGLLTRPQRIVIARRPV